MRTASWVRSVEAGRAVTFSCDSCHSRLTIPRAPASFRLCSSDLEQYSGRTAAAVWLQSEQQKTGKRSTVDTSRRGVASRRDEESCAGLPDNVNEHLGDLVQTRAPSTAARSHGRVVHVPSGLGGHFMRGRASEGCTPRSHIALRRAYPTPICKAQARGFTA